MKKLFILPSIGHLRKLLVDNSVEASKLDLEYMQQHTKGLSKKEQVVVLLLDEVYTAQRVEYTNGSFVGLTENSFSVKTVLTFMVQSIAGKYKDVICCIPVNRLDTNLLRKWLNKILEALHDYLVVVAVCADNHVCNR